MHRIFVYGTLKRSFGNWSMLLKDRSTFVGTAVSEPTFTMLGMGGFPGIIHGGSTRIHGEVFEVNDVVLRDLDRLEGHPSWYERQPLQVTLEDGSTLAVEGYVLPEAYRHRHREVPGGRWPAANATNVA